MVENEPEDNLQNNDNNEEHFEEDCYVYMFEMEEDDDWDDDDTYVDRGDAWWDWETLDMSLPELNIGMSMEYFQDKFIDMPVGFGIGEISNLLTIYNWRKIKDIDITDKTMFVSKCKWYRCVIENRIDIVNGALVTSDSLKVIIYVNIDNRILHNHVTDIKKLKEILIDIRNTRQ